MSGLLGTITSGLLGASSVPSSAASVACAALAANTNALVELWPSAQHTSQYQTAQGHYWSSANADNVPACVVLPQSADDVSDIVKVLLGYSNILFAVKSGGHNPNVGWASSKDVLISMSNINTTTLSSDQKTATISPGATWAQTVAALEPYGKSVVGGRVVLNYEVVLANGTIVDASLTSNPELFWALKGGGNQFGIVTKFTVNTVPMGQVWGGYRTYSSHYASQLLAATQDFAENFHDPAAAMFTTCEILLSNLDQFITVFYFYNGPIVPAGVFDNFLAVPSTGDQTATRSFSSLLNTNAGIASIYGLRYNLRGVTIPNLPSQTGINLMMTNYNNWISYINKQGLAGTTFIFTYIYQPVMTAIPAASKQANPFGNALDLSTNYGDQMWMAATVAWLSSDQDASAHSMLTTIMNNTESYVKNTYPNFAPSNFPDGGDIDHVSKPAFFMNDAMFDQQVLQGYGTKSYQRLQAVKKAYDPIGFFTNRTGGFKL